MKSLTDIASGFALSGWLLVIMTGFYVSGGILLKRFAEGHGWQWFAASALV